MALPSVKFSGKAIPLVLVWDNSNFPLVSNVRSSNPKQVPHTGK